MNSKGYRILVSVPLIAVVWGLCLFADKLSYGFGAAVAARYIEVLAILRDPATQWMVFLCVGVHLVVFILVGCSQRRFRFRLMENGDVWLIGVQVAGALAYALDYTNSSVSCQPLVLMAGATLGKGAAIWSDWLRRSHNGASLSVLAVVTLVVLLLAASLWQAVTGRVFQYRGHARWSGPWDNPNTFGMLMGVGLVLAVGRAVSGVRCSAFVKLRRDEQVSGEDESKVQSFGNANERHLTPAISPNEAERGSGTPAAWRCVKILLFLTAAGLCGLGLVKSFSRGAWVGAAGGLGFMAYQVVMCPAFTGFLRDEQVSGRGAFVSWFRKNWLPVSVILASVLVLAFWNFRYTGLLVARRAFSVGNVNDFSWRNRVASYEGALQMMAERPLLGFGWNQPERVYDQFYRAPKVDEGAAIQLNDYFTLGTTLGIPALVCFCAFVGLSLTTWSAERRTGTSPRPSPLSGEGDWLSAICRAGVVVLLVGFWFDGGLLKLATGSMFWILLSLGSER